MEKYIVFNDEGEILEEIAGESFKEIVKEFDLLRKKFFDKKIVTEQEERNDVCIYKTLRYPPKSIPPTLN